MNEQTLKWSEISFTPSGTGITVQLIWSDASGLISAMNAIHKWMHNTNKEIFSR